MMMWVKMHPDATVDHLGAISMFLNLSDERPAAEQFDANYQHGGGWRPMTGWTRLAGNVLQYGDPQAEDADAPLPPLWLTTLRDETVCVYRSAFVAIIQPDKSFEVSRMD